MKKIIATLAFATAISGAVALPASAQTAHQGVAQSQVMANTAERSGYYSAGTVTGGPSGGSPYQH